MLSAASSLVWSTHQCLQDEQGNYDCLIAYSEEMQWLFLQMERDTMDDACSVLKPYRVSQCRKQC